MKSFIFLFALLFGTLLGSHVASRADDICDSQKGAWNETAFTGLIDGLKKISFNDEKVAYVVEKTTGNPDGFTGIQIVALLDQFTYWSTREEVLTFLNSSVISLTCQDVVTIFTKFGLSSDKLNILQKTIDIVIREDLKQNNQTIIDAFTFNSDKALAKKIIENSRGRSCLWGDTNEPRINFVVDVSGSMSTSFKINGQSYTRLSYVKKELDEVIRFQLRSDQFFNVYKFSSAVSAWAPGLQPVNTTSIDSAVRFVAGLAAGGSTNAFSALEKAFSDPDVEGIYFLSDGQPDSGQAARILNQVDTWEKGRNPKVPVHTTALAAPSDAQEFMRQLAKKTGGNYRAIQ